MSTRKRWVLALGGSVVYPGEVDTVFLQAFYKLIKQEIKEGRRFIIVVGGGVISRAYQKAISKIIRISNEDKDWIGIHVTRLNAHLVRTIFKKEAHPIVADTRFRVRKFGKNHIIVGSGWKPGWSTDYVSIQLAIDFGIREVIVLGKPAYVYTSDFERDKSAVPIERMNWAEYLKLIPSQWTPGMHAPVDPIAARLARKENIKVVIADGKNLANLKKILKGAKFEGTTLENYA